MRRCVCRCIFFCIIIANFSHTVLLFPQEEGGNNTVAIFPLTLVLEAARCAEESLRGGFGAGFGAGIWKPDWPLNIPPDVFRVESGEVSSCTVELEGFTLCLGFGTEGRLEEFPFNMNGSLAQATVVYQGLSGVTEIILNFPSGGEVCKLEFPENFTFNNYFNFFPFLVRGLVGNAWYLINFSGSVNEILETWYDGEGNALGAFGFSLAETGNENKIRKYWNFSDPDSITEFYYDSRGFVTEVVGPEGFFRVLYFREDLPRYWERGPSGAVNFPFQTSGAPSDGGVFTFQWDEGNSLVRLLGDTSQFVDYRYEYNLDEMGNWAERKETRMIRDFGLLLPSPGSTFIRILEYVK